MKTVIAQFIEYKQEDQDAAGKPEGQVPDADKGINLIIENIPESNQEKIIMNYVTFFVDAISFCFFDNFCFPL